MLGLIGIIAILVVLGLSLIITRLATVALVMTGLSEEAAKFQARSAFTGTGYTTAEAESIVDHPVRRRVVMLLMILRSAGLISIIISLILSFVGTATDQAKLLRLAFLAGGVFVLWVLAQSNWIDRAMKRLMERVLRRYTQLPARDYVGLLNLSGPYMVSETSVDEDDWLAGQTLSECDLYEEGVMVLGIYRSDGTYLGVPKGDTQIEPGDRLILYGRSDPLEELDRRKAGSTGEQAHQQAVDEQQREEAKQEADEQESKKRRNERSQDEPSGQSD